jgi:chromosome segregation ATPase
MTKRLTINDVWGLAKSSLSACKEHNETINKMATHVNELWKEIGLKQDRIKFLEDQIQDKDFEIDDLNKAHTDQLWDLAKLEQENLKLKKDNEEMKEVCGGVAQFEKKIKQHIKKGSVDN